VVSNRIRVQLAVFVVLALTVIASLVLGYMQVPARWFGIGQYTVRVELPDSGALYQGSTVTYRGTEVGRVQAVHLTNSGVEADLSLTSSIPIPSDLDAQVHSQTAIGEQYVALLPRNAAAPPLRNGAVIPRSRTSVPPDIGSLLDAVNRGVQAIPHENLKTVVDESSTAFGGLGPELSHIVKDGSALAIDAAKNRDELTALIDGAKPILDTQTDTSDAVQAWAAHLANVTDQLRSQDSALAGVLTKAGPATDEVRQLLDRLKPTLPILLANLVSVGAVAVLYQNDIEQLLVLIPQGVDILQGFGVANLNTKQGLRGLNMAFNLNLNMPPPCTTGFLPAQQRRPPTFEDAPDRPAGDLYCRIPQDSAYRDVRGARNIPCETAPGKRAPTVKMCESNEQYVPLNDGNNWKGDPNATYSGQDVPQLPPGTARSPSPLATPRSPPSPPGPPAAPANPPPPVPAVAAAQYDPATGTYLGPDGNIYTQTDLAHNAPKEQTWQTMLMPPTSN
jgi:phospholipid/cholesterol/gamma-HCH transport system substrate-binding protein